MRSLALLTLAAGASAPAAFMQLDHPITLEQDSSVSVELVGAWAGAAGDVYFLGADSNGQLNASADTGEPGLGKRLFNSKDAPGTTIDLGDFTAGSALHFAYLITKGWSDAVIKGDVMRSDRTRDQIQLAWDEDESTPALYRLGWEDIRDPKRSDWDYQDAVFDVHISPSAARAVPAPGTMTLLALTGATLAARRRR